MNCTLSQLNRMSQAEFTQALGDLFEHTPDIASQAWGLRPFADLDALHQALVQSMKGLSEARQVDLIDAHPDLATRAQMAEASVREQTTAGLTALSPEEYDQFARLNRSYREKFGFPFIIAVRHHTKHSILAAFESRLRNSVESEKEIALSQIAEIARLRLRERVQV